ncbi:DUF262 domain-containing protein [Demequina rhizosphaerae]|uniref:DUF262 domain-containing protein n=1 Tax=Demequina rhizosphaerae TaxID=1638985 RepID=UPI00078645AA|nr:DUF262 domain-containing protein [Demequina rhizosphaerae]
MDSTEDIGPGSVASVGSLVRMKLDDGARWNLALVQRDEVWNADRMRSLLDSLLAGYPIGAILLSSVEGESSEYVTTSDGIRRSVVAPGGTWQLLDGQQRINALFSIFTDQGRYGRFLLNIAVERPEPSPVQRTRGRKTGLGHIVHVPQAADDAFELPPQRGHYLDLSGWESWARTESAMRLGEVSEANVIEVAQAIDSKCGGDLDPEQLGHAVVNLRRLRTVWNQPLVPILGAALKTPLDVLEVFTRVNLGGVSVAGNDVYFAGVKTFWPDAEAVLDGFRKRVPLLRSRIEAVRFLSRLASVGLGHGDVLPLSVERLSGPKGALLQGAMRELGDADGNVCRKLAAFVEWYTGASELRYGLREVTPQLFEEVLAWAAAVPAEYDLAASRDAIDAYLLGATLFDYRGVLGDTFRRIAFHQALESGARGEGFPATEILLLTRARTRLAGRRGAGIRSLAECRSEHARSVRRGRLLTTLAQRIPYDVELEDKYDWDHIFPSGQAHRMTVPGVGNRRKHHPYRRWVNTPGNLWALKDSVNRGLGMKVGRDKFDILRDLVHEGEGPKIWDQARWSIEESEIESFIRVDELLKGSDDDIDRAMDLFKETVEGRAHRLFDEAVARFRGVEEFASDSDVGSYDADPYMHDYRGSLGIMAADPLLKVESPESARRRLASRVASVLREVERGLPERGVVATSRTWKNSNNRQGRVDEFAVLKLQSGNSIELMFRWERVDGLRVEVKAYPDPTKPNGRHVYQDFDHYALGVDFSNADAEIAERFLDEVVRLEEVHPRT